MFYKSEIGKTEINNADNFSRVFWQGSTICVNYVETIDVNIQFITLFGRKFQIYRNRYFIKRYKEFKKIS